MREKAKTMLCFHLIHYVHKKRGPLVESGGS